MSTPPYAELVAAVRREGEAIVAAARDDLDVEVPTCPDWRMRDLALHVAGTFSWVSKALNERATSRVDYPPPPPDSTHPVDHLSGALDELVGAFTDTSPDAPAWNWTGGEQVAAFWARRMAHEAGIHRYDAQKAHGLAQPMDADLARDGLDELTDVLVPAVIGYRKPALPVGRIVFSESDSGDTWCLDFTESSMTRLDVIKAPDVTVTGTASALELAAYNRVPWSSLEVAGDATLLNRWSEAFRF